MIEFVPPRQDAFGDTDPADFVGVDVDDQRFDDEPSPPRWPAAIAGLAVAALLAGGVLAAAPWDDEATPPVPPTATSTPPATPTAGSTAGSTGTPERGDPLVPDALEFAAPWLLPEDSGWVLSSSFANDGSASRGDAFRFLTVEGSTRTSGRWLAFDALDPGEPSPLRRDATRIVLDGDSVTGAPGGSDGRRVALVSSTDDGVTELIVGRAPSPDGDASVVGATRFVVTGFGWSLEELVAIARGTDLAGRRFEHLPELTASDGPLDAMRVVFDGSSDWYTGQPRAATPFSWASYARPEEFEFVTVTVEPLAMPTVFIDEFLLQIPIDTDSLRRAERAALAELASNGRRVTLFESAAVRGVVGATWFDGDGHRVAVVGTVPVHELLDLVAALEPVTVDEWQAATSRRPPSDPFPNPVIVGGGDGSSWGAELVGGWLVISGAGGEVSSEVWTPPAGRATTVYATATDRYVVITDAEGLATRAVVRDGADGPTQEVTLVRVADFGSIGVVRLDHDDPLDVTWLAPDGTELASAD
ncbi:MAG: hypothetical protein KDB40_16870 [Acidimicrobiales bacterium]|nr:hypothetical protein [Acidimicrobiales bacterium]MCB9392420.1 hypothetical protein [Acidimicrobiaceae bacterium]